MIYWKRFDKVEKQQLRKVQKEAQEQRKQDLNMLEVEKTISFVYLGRPQRSFR